jgi:CubicO group peptidase (beta-lactamase class C family)
MQLESNLERWLAAYQAPDTPGAALAILQSGKIVHQSATGLAELSRAIPISSTTNFRLASLTKSFTSTAILLLEKDSTLHLEQSLLDFFPELPNCIRPITVHHLLQHTSGLPDYELLLPANLSTQISDSDILKLISTTPGLLFSPGTKFLYSNTSYALLSLIAEKVSQIPFPAFLKSRIFDPLNMRNSVAYVAGRSEVPNRAFGYTFSNGKFKLTDQSATSAVLGDGGIYSSLNDLVHWMNALFSSDTYFFHPARFTSGKLINGEPIPYGYGWQINLYRGLRTISHSGSTIGFRHFIAHFPALDLGIICLTNRSEPLPHELLKAILEPFATHLPTSAADELLARKIVGTDPLDPYSP